MIKHNRFILVLALVTTLFSACLDDENTTEHHLITFTESVDGGAGVLPTEKREEYQYIGTRLVKHILKQQYYDQEVAHEVNLYYQERRVYIEDTYGNSAQYTLNDEGAATECSYTEPHSNQIRLFTFGYTMSGQLESISETINKEPISSVLLHYDNGNLSSSLINGHRTNYTASNEANKNQLPCLFLTETYPIYLHKEAIYAGILGKATKHLVGRITPENNEKEWTDYAYQFDTEEILTQIQESTTSTGIVIDSDGNKSEITNTQVRKIGITIK